MTYKLNLKHLSCMFCCRQPLAFDKRSGKKQRLEENERESKKESGKPTVRKKMKDGDWSRKGEGNGWRA